MRRLTKNFRMAALTLAVASGAAIVVPSQASAQAQPTLEGVWRVTRHGVNCVTGQAVNSFPALMTFHKDGTVKGDAVAPQSTPAAGTSEQGLWRREPGGQNYSFSLLNYIWDPVTGAFQGSTEVTAALQLITNDSLAYTSHIQILDAAGNPIVAHCGRATGTRFELARDSETF